MVGVEELDVFRAIVVANVGPDAPRPVEEVGVEGVDGVVVGVPGASDEEYCDGEGGKSRKNCQKDISIEVTSRGEIRSSISMA